MSEPLSPLRPFPPPPFAPPAPVVQDPLPWSEPARLVGPAERHRFGPGLLAIVGGLAAIVVFQALALLATSALLWEELAAGADFAAVLAEHADTVFAANALGQLVGLAMVALLLARLHTPDVLAYLRLGRPDAGFLLLAAVGLYALLPFVSVVGQWARAIPWPEALRAWDAQQQAVLAQVLQGNVTLWLALVFVALTPALCEELLFRGYLQRNVERVMRPAAAVLVMGLAFGLFHLRFVELIPLTVLGVYLSYVVWVSGSLWPGVLVHLLNNATAVVVSQRVAARPEVVALEDIAVPWYLGLLGLAAALAVAVRMHRRRTRLAAISASTAPPAPRP